MRITEALAFERSSRLAAGPDGLPRSNRPAEQRIDGVAMGDRPSLSGVRVPTCVRTTGRPATPEIRNPRIRTPGYAGFWIVLTAFLSFVLCVPPLHFLDVGPAVVSEFLALWVAIGLKRRARRRGRTLIWNQRHPLHSRFPLWRISTAPATPVSPAASVWPRSARAPSPTRLRPFRMLRGRTIPLYC